MDEDIESFLRRVAVQPPPNASALLQRQGTLGMGHMHAAPVPIPNLGGHARPGSQEPTLVPGMSKMNVGGNNPSYLGQNPSPSPSPGNSWLGHGNPAAEPTLIPGQMAPPMADMTLVPGQNINDFANRTVILTFQSNDPYFPTMQREVVKTLQIGRKMDNHVEGDPLFIGYETKVVSRKHAEVFLQNGEVFLKDLGSQAGTYINNGRLSQPGQPSNPVKLNAGDMVQFGTDFRDRNIKEQRAVLVTVQLAPGRLQGGGSGTMPMAQNPAFAALNVGRKNSLTSLEDLRPMAQSPPSNSGSRPSMAFTTGSPLARSSVVMNGGVPPMPSSGMVRSPSAQSIGGSQPNLANLTMMGGTLKR